jgi:hypothetical protein
MSKTTAPMTIPANFKLALIIVTGLTVVSLLVIVIISIFQSDVQKMSELPEHQRRIFDICSFCWQSGFGGILGLIGGKMTGA